MARAATTIRKYVMGRLATRSSAAPTRRSSRPLEGAASTLTSVAAALSAPCSAAPRDSSAHPTARPAWIIFSLDDDHPTPRRNGLASHAVTVTPATFDQSTRGRPKSRNRGSNFPIDETGGRGGEQPRPGARGTVPASWWRRGGSHAAIRRRTDRDRADFAHRRLRGHRGGVPGGARRERRTDPRDGARDRGRHAAPTAARLQGEGILRREC